MIDPRDVPVHVIVNPAARSGQVGRNIGAVRAELARALGTPVIELTRGPGDGARLAAQAAEQGARVVLALGGDGTFGEVAHGLLSGGGAANGVVAGLIPAGTGGDFRRLMRVDADAEYVARSLREGRIHAIDAGHVTLRGRDGAPWERFFVNIASFGVAGLVDELVARSPRIVNGRVTYMIATVRAALRYRPATLRLRLDGTDIDPLTVTNVAIANGRYFGGGMMVAPRARLDDGLLDVVALCEEPIHQGLATLRALYDGSHLARPAVRCWRARVIEIGVDDGEAWADIDGECPGSAPVVARVVPAALRVAGLRAGVADAG